MNKIEALKKLVEIIKSSDVRSEDSYIVIEFKEPYTDQEKSNAKEVLLRTGYTKLDDPFEGDTQLWIDKRAAHWLEGDCVFYTNIESLWQRCYRAESLPNNFIIVDTKISFLDSDSDNTLVTIRLYFSWKKLLHTLCDHYANDFYVFFLMNEKGGDKIEIESAIELSQLPSLNDTKKYLDLADDLQDKLDFKDLHQLERRSVMRATLSEVTKEKGKENDVLPTLLLITPLFSKKYNELYEIYTKRYSVNKLLNELDEKSLEFTSKITEFISSSQTKALTIPGALIAVGALAKVDAPLEAIIIVGGLWMIKKVNNSSNDVYREAFAALENRLSNAFQKYLKFHNELEVKTSAEQIKDELSVLIDKSSKRLLTLDRLANLMFYGGLGYVFIKMNSSPIIISLLDKIDVLVQHLCVI
ncbi:hypothetical protein ERD95_23835 [Enterobacteriaceae bacterium ML5]|nr:hypothetical protein ERD95_23835 [Enterobacteriaceae bacterium ML5]